MLHQTKGIVLHHIKYSETSVVAYIFTEMFGRQTYMINGIRSRKSKGKMALLQPLSLLEMQVHYRPKNSMQRIAEMGLSPHLHTIPFDAVKSCIVMFLAEILYKTLKHEEQDPALFHFMHHSIQYFDLAEAEQKADFHLMFLFYLSRHLGFFPENNYAEGRELFDLVNGNFVSLPPLHKAYLTIDESKQMLTMFDASSDFSFRNNLKLNKKLRTQLLDILLRYYAHHAEGLQNIKSLQVLKEVFR